MLKKKIWTPDKRLPISKSAKFKKLSLCLSLNGNLCLLLLQNIFTTRYSSVTLQLLNFFKFWHLKPDVVVVVSIITRSLELLWNISPQKTAILFQLSLFFFSSWSKFSVTASPARSKSLENSMICQRVVIEGV